MSMTGLTTNAVSLAMGGDATFNLASVYRVGFFEFSVGKNGVHSKFGMGGTNISYHNLKAAYGGISEAKKVSEWKYNMGEEKKRTLNAINMLGYTNAGNNGQLAGEIWNGTKNVEYRNLDGEYGHFNASEDPNKVILSDTLLGKGKEASAMLATVMSHEGTHVYGNRIEGKAHAVGFSTYGQLMNQFGIKGNDTMLDSMMDAYFDKSSWTENSGDVDYWSLAKKSDGSYGWAEDGSLEFNISRTDLEELARKDIKEAILLLGSAGANFYNGKSDTFKLASSENMTIDVAYKLAGLVGIKDTAYKGLPWETPQYEYDMAQLDFARNTLLFADASNAAKKLMGKNGLSQDNIIALNKTLYAVQESGLVVKNPYTAIADNGLIGKGTLENPYLPLTGDVSITCLSGFRFVTEDFYNSLKEDNRGYFPLNNFAKNEHIHTDLISDNFNIVTSVNGAIKLNYDDTWGLNGTNYSADGHIAFLSNHMDPSSIKNYISLFGMQGTSMQKAGNGSYYMDGIKAGSIYGQMGQTGISGGKHVDFGIYQTKNPFRLNIYGDTRSPFVNIYDIKYQDAWVTNFSGLSTNNILDNYPSINNYLMRWNINNVPNYSKYPYRG